MGFRVPPASRVPPVSRPGTRERAFWHTRAGVSAYGVPRGATSPARVTSACEAVFYCVARGAVSGRVPKSTFGTFFASAGASKYFCGRKPKAFA